jgi:hypothetical protein
MLGSMRNRILSSDIRLNYPSALLVSRSYVVEPSTSSECSVIRHDGVLRGVTSFAIRFAKGKECDAEPPAGNNVTVDSPGRN